MNYREKLLRQQNKNQVAKLELEITNLQNSTNKKALEKAQKEQKKTQNLLDNTIEILGLRNISDLSNLLQGKTLKELVQENQELKNTDSHKTITHLENKLADQKGELQQTKREKESLLKTQQKLEDQIQTANYQLEGLVKNIEKGLVKGEKNILTQIKVVQSLLSKD